MKKAIAMRWVKALRSGKYKQTTGGLRDVRGFCCLGVLCDLHARAHPEFAATQLDPEVYDGESGLPPDIVVEWAGLSDPDPELWVRGVGSTHLSNLNDGMHNTKPWSFKRIANVIEKHWKEL